MGVLQSIPLCSRERNRMVEPLDLDKNNNTLEDTSEIHTSQPSALPPPEATSTPRPTSPTGIINDQYSDSLSSAENDIAQRHNHAQVLSSGHDSGLEESATEFEFS